ncbi:hypothetical protein SDC9_163595 [bioreactor metagenome]|uniref:Uncharacterized protein n=1 Tax=bioreactor metagenome TaxID=1076179 RepID=A0A645FPA4_9ZZZZ
MLSEIVAFSVTSLASTKSFIVATSTAVASWKVAETSGFVLVCVEPFAGFKSPIAGPSTSALALTVTSQVAFTCGFSFETTVIVAVPALTALTVPLVTVATVGSLLIQSTFF